MLRSRSWWRRSAAGGGGGGGGLPLDAVQGIVLAAYSYQRRLFSNFTGIPYRMRNTNNNATADVVFTGDAVNLADIDAFSPAGHTVVVDTAWFDQSGNNNHASVVGNVSITNIALGSYAGMRCGDSDYFELPAGLYSGRTSGAIFGLFAAPAWTSRAYWISPDIGTPYHPYEDWNIYDNFLSTSRPNLGNMTGFSGDSAEWRLQTVQQTGTQLVARWNDALVGQAAATFSATLTTRRIQPPRGWEFVLLSRNPTPEEREYIAAALLWGKYGDGSKLPEGHTYRNAAPVALPA